MACHHLFDGLQPVFEHRILWIQLHGPFEARLCFCELTELSECHAKTGLGSCVGRIQADGFAKLFCRRAHIVGRSQRDTQVVVRVEIVRAGL